MIVVAAFKTPAVVTGLDDVAVMSQAVEQRSGHLGVAEHARPFADCQISGDDDGGSLVKPADEVEQELTTGLCERQVAQLVKNDEVHAGQMFREPALPTVSGLGLEPVNEVDDVVKAPSRSIADTASGYGDGQMRLASSEFTDEQDWFRTINVAAFGQVSHLRRRHIRRLRVIELLQRFHSRQTSFPDSAFNRVAFPLFDLGQQ